MKTLLTFFVLFFSSSVVAKDEHIIDENIYYCVIDSILGKQDDFTGKIKVKKPRFSIKISKHKTDLAPICLSTNVFYRNDEKLDEGITLKNNIELDENYNVISRSSLGSFMQELYGPGFVHANQLGDYFRYCVNDKFIGYEIEFAKDSVINPWFASILLSDNPNNFYNFGWHMNFTTKKDTDLLEGEFRIFEDAFDGSAYVYFGSCSKF